MHPEHTERYPWIQPDGFTQPTTPSTSRRRNKTLPVSQNSPLGIGPGLPLPRGNHDVDLNLIDEFACFRHSIYGVIYSVLFDLWLLSLSIIFGGSSMISCVLVCCSFLLWRSYSIAWLYILPVLLLMNVLGCFHVEFNMTALLWTFLYMSFGEQACAFLFGVCLRVKVLGSRVCRSSDLVDVTK